MFGVQSRRPDSRPTSKDGGKKNIWDSMLAEAARGKELPEKQLLILGGTPEHQRDLLEVLSPELQSAQYQRDRQRRRKVPVSNLYALGYTYQDVLDADHEDILARLSIYMLAEPSPAFSALLTPLLNSRTIPNTLIVILLNWSDPHNWARHLRQWIRLLRSVLITLDEETKIAMEENMTEWKERRKGTELASSNQPNGSNVIPPLGPGEWDEGLGIPLCVVCQNAEKMDTLEKESGWQEEDFDFALQVLRTVLLKHGSSLVYTSSFESNSARQLVHSSLGIHSMLKREPIKHNVIDRDKILVPPNWDSHGKIRIQREGFDPERIGTLWSIDIQDPPEDSIAVKATESAQDPADPSTPNGTSLDSADSILPLYTASLPDPNKTTSFNALPASTNRSTETITAPEMQSFLSSQAEVLETLKQKDEQEQKELGKGGHAKGFIGSKDQKDAGEETGRKMAESIGPVQFNMGGIQVDAEEAVRRLKEREATRTPIKSPIQETLGAVQTAGAKSENAALQNFFTSLMNKGGTGSPRTPGVGGATGSGGK